MRVLLDECLPRRLKQSISGHEVATVPEMGWAEKATVNCSLLRVSGSTSSSQLTVTCRLNSVSVPDRQSCFSLRAAIGFKISSLSFPSCWIP